MNKFEDIVAVVVVVVVVEVVVDVEVVDLVVENGRRPLFRFHCCMIFVMIFCLSELRCSLAN